MMHLASKGEISECQIQKWCIKIKIFIVSNHVRDSSDFPTPPYNFDCLGQLLFVQMDQVSNIRLPAISPKCNILTTKTFWDQN